MVNFIDSMNDLVQTKQQIWVQYIYSKRLTAAVLRTLGRNIGTHSSKI